MRCTARQPAIDLPALGVQCNDKLAGGGKATARVRGWNPVMEVAHSRIRVTLNSSDLAKN